MKFPAVSGSNLLRQKVSLPDDLAGQVRLLLIAFQQWHQSLVDSWVPAARQLEQDVPGLRFYELPVIQQMNGLYQTFINEGMRAGIPNPTTRQKTITLYLDKPAFRKALAIPDEQTIWLLVLDRDGNVIWRTDGGYTAEKAAALSQAIRSLGNEPAPIPG
ncbi:MAG: hypothetical protein MUE67_01520 [Anaerolineales bacterium]|nr:hypothetical protein [Anaerolineales bacterium]